MTEEVEKKVCEGTVADLMKDKTGKQTVVTLTRKNAYRVKKIREQGTDNEAVLFHFRKRCTGMGSYVHTIETADGETELHPNEFEKWEAVEFLYPGYLEDLLDAAYNAYRWSSFEPEARAETDIMQYEKQLVEDLKLIPEEKQNEYGRTLHHLFVHHLERNEIHVKGHIRGVLYLGMEIKQVIMGVYPFEQILDTETLTADMTDTALVILIHGFHDKTYQTG